VKVRGKQNPKNETTANKQKTSPSKPKSGKEKPSVTSFQTKGKRLKKRLKHTVPKQSQKIRYEPGGLPLYPKVRTVRVEQTVSGTGREGKPNGSPWGGKGFKQPNEKRSRKKGKGERIGKEFPTIARNGETEPDAEKPSPELKGKKRATLTKQKKNPKSRPSAKGSLQKNLGEGQPKKKRGHDQPSGPMEGQWVICWQEGE